MDSIDFINRANADYIDRLYQQYQSDPRSVDAYWRAFFAGFEAAGGRAGSLASAFGTAESVQPEDAKAGVEVKNLVHSYRELGHFIADLDPLGHNRPSHPLLELGQFGLTNADLDKRVTHSDFLGPTDGTLRDLVAKLRETYCRTIGVEFTNITDKTQREWLIQRMEPILNRPKCAGAECKARLYELVAAQGFEDFLAIKRPPGDKRFGLEGGESLIPLINALIEVGSDLGVEEFVMGMAHRGRLNVLAHVLNKPYEVILREFMGTRVADDGDGDVKYHLGYSQDKVAGNGRPVHIALSYNPSHLELVDPVVVGIVRAKQNYLGDHANRVRVVPILMHGDAAFTGQGIVHETLGLSELPYYRTGGTIHVIINNQIGFTTLPRQGRFTPYPTDVAKMIQAPIFHVNGDDPDACVHAAKLAIAFRQEFHCDVMIDFWCYRKNGHNESDEPSYTQPLMYKEIAGKTTVRDLYAKTLMELGMLSAEEFDEMKAEARTRFDKALEHAGATVASPVTAFGGVWKNISKAGADWSAVTKVPAELLKKVGEGATRVPAGFTVHPKLKPLLARRLEMSLGTAPIDWGGAEMLALGTLVLEGTPIRFTGQDTQRGTFSHRHASLRDYETGEKYVPLANISENQAPIIIVNTMLSELAVLGFEYGFSSADPRNLVLWEAQFGDFVNMAQPIIDQFIVAAESKWQKYSGLVMLLPHGYEGMGPEHSYAYLDRFLSLCADNNIQVVYPSTPAQYFHALRRQMRRTFRKPLILMMPKKNLRDAVSTLTDLTEGTFQLVIDDPNNPPRDRVRRVILCSGKIYFMLEAARQKAGIEDVAIVRVEQLYPYPQKELQAILAKYRNAHEYCWAQEEPKNRGAWVFMSDRLEPMLPETTVLTYSSREESASPAVGSYKVSNEEEAEIVQRALELPPESSAAPAPVKTDAAVTPELEAAKVAPGPGVGAD